MYQKAHNNRDRYFCYNCANKLRVFQIPAYENIMIFTKTSDVDFNELFNELLERGKMDIEHVSEIVGEIINEIKTDKNSALKKHIAKFDNWAPATDADLKIDTASMAKAYNCSK